MTLEVSSRAFPTTDFVSFFAVASSTKTLSHFRLLETCMYVRGSIDALSDPLGIYYYYYLEYFYSQSREFTTGPIHNHAPQHYS